MSQKDACHDKGHRAGAHWVVTARNCHYSAFSGYQRTFSKHSAVRCLKCGAWWRTAAKYVCTLRDASGDEATRAVTP